jgi:hypothetical protein
LPTRNPRRGPLLTGSPEHGRRAPAAAARHDEAKRALEAADGAAFSRAARARGGRSIADGLIIDPALQRAVDAALAGIGRAQVLPRAEIGAVTSDRGVAIASESLAGAAPEPSAPAVSRIVEVVRARGGGLLAEAVRRDDTGAVTRLLARIVWLPDAAACLDLQASLPAGWQAVARDGSVVVGDVATWIRPEGRGLHLQADVDRLAAERAAAEAVVRDAEAAHAIAETALTAAAGALATAREREGLRGPRTASAQKSSSGQRSPGRMPPRASPHGWSAGHAPPRRGGAPASRGTRSRPEQKPRRRPRRAARRPRRRPHRPIATRRLSEWRPFAGDARRLRSRFDRLARPAWSRAPPGAGGGRRRLGRTPAPVRRANRRRSR